MTLDNLSGKTVTVRYRTSDGTATAGSDYTSTNGTLTFTSGTGTQTIAVSVTDDSLDEEDEHFTVTLQSPSNATLADASATGTIIDDNDTPGLSIADARADESDGRLRFPVTLVGASAQTVTVGYRTSDGTATAGSDYTSTNGTLTFTSGTGTQTIAVSVTDDSLDEEDEHFTVTLQSPSNATLADASATGTIIDDNDTPGLSIADARADESDGRLRFPVTLVGASAQTVTVRYSTSDGTATAGSDYTSTNGTLTFTSGTGTQTIAVSVTDDSLDEEDEHFTVTLQSPSGATLEDASAIGTIINDDGSVVVPPIDDDTKLSISNAQAQEDDGHIHFPVTLDSAGTQTVTVSYGTSNGTATAGSDYTTTNGTLTFTSGTLARTIAVAVTDDSSAEEEESLAVTLRSPSNAALAHASATGIIIDDDGPEDDHGDWQLTATTVVPATATTAQDPIAGHLETDDDVDYFRVVADAGETVSALINVSTQPGNYVYRVHVRIESASYTSSNIDGYDAAALSSSTTVFVRVWSRRGTPQYNLAIWLRDRNIPEDTTFDIELVYPSETVPSTSQRATIRAAADAWESVISKGLPANLIGLSGPCQYRGGGSNTHSFGSFVDDLSILFRVEAIDGAGGVWAQAAVCNLRGGENESGLPYISMVTFDVADISRVNSVALRTLAIHEMGHALGFGTIDEWDALLVNSTYDHQSSNPGSTTLQDSHFSGAAAVSAFNEITSSYTGAKVPVENDVVRFPDGSWDGHWRESVFGTELMTPVITSSALSIGDPLSKVTIAALADLGYSVDYTQAESYTLPSSSSVSGSQLPGTVLPQLLHFRDEVIRGPVEESGIPKQEIPVIR